MNYKDISKIIYELTKEKKKDCDDDWTEGYKAGLEYAIATIKENCAESEELRESIGISIDCVSREAVYKIIEEIEHGCQSNEVAKAAVHGVKVEIDRLYPTINPWEAAKMLNDCCEKYKACNGCYNCLFHLGEGCAINCPNIWKIIEILERIKKGEDNE